MIKLASKDECTGCMSCVNSCSIGAIRISRDDSNGFDYPEIEKDKCILCGKCMKSCPVLLYSPNYNVKKADSLDIGELYAAVNINTNARLTASSGGIFEILSNYIISNGGVVFGAEFDETFGVKHNYAESMDGVVRFKTSKYVQSYISKDIYKKCYDFCENDRMVLFTGTSCQINGLYTYLKKDYSNLYTLDLICSGNTSPGLWKKYLEYRENKQNSKICSVNFRDKTFGWDRFSLKISFLSGKKYIRILPNDEWGFFFLKHYAQRECCYSCKYKDIHHKSDFTLGDFWGVQLSYPELYDDKGLSFVLINSLKAKQLLDSDELNSIWTKKIPIDMLEKHNTTIVKSPMKPKDRDRFYEDFSRMSFGELSKKYVKIPLWRKNNNLFDSYWRLRISLSRCYHKFFKR